MGLPLHSFGACYVLDGYVEHVGTCRSQSAGIQVSACVGVVLGVPDSSYALGH